MDGLPLGHHSLSLPTEYNYHHAMAQHAAAVSASGNAGLHSSSMGQIQMLPTGLNLSMNASSQTMTPRMPTNMGGNSHQHLSHMTMQGQMQQHHHAMPHGKKKKPKVNKDGIPAPKRAMTAYINFTQWYREDQKKSGRQIPKIGEFGKECAEKWKHMGEDDKQPFLDIAAQDRERYKKEMAIYKPPRDENKPKRPGTAFMLFMGDLRKEMAGREPEGGVAALAKLGGERWRGMTDEDKRKYVEKQSEEKMRYESLMEDYRREYPQQGMMSMGPMIKQPRLEEPSQDSNDSLEGSSTSNAVPSAMSQIPQLTQQTSNSGSSSPSRSNAQTPASHVSSSSPPPPTLSPGPTLESAANNLCSTSGVTTTAESTNSSMAAISSMSMEGGNSSMAALSSMSGGDGGNSSMAAISSMSSSMSLSQAMAMGYAQQSLQNFAHGSSMVVPNFNQAHNNNNNNTTNNTTVSSSPYLQSNTYTQPHLPGPYNWT